MGEFQDIRNYRLELANANKAELFSPKLKKKIFIMKTKWKNLFKELDYYETVQAGSSESFMKGREASPRDVIYDRVDIL